MEILRPEEMGKLEWLAGREFAQRWQGMVTKLSKEATVTIANTGLVNAGKSSLFNALLDKEEHFAVGTTRTTSEGEWASLNGWIDILDTPGIDAAENDDDKAFASVVQSDLIVAVHNIKIGMLNRAEYEWLERLAKHMTRKEKEQRIIFACSWIDERDRQNDYQSVVAETRRQVFEVLGTDKIPFWEISAKRYISARKNGKKALEKASRLPEFREYLLTCAEEARKTADQRRRAELAALCRETQRRLQAKKSDLQNTIRQKESKVQRQYQPARDTWISILRNFISSRESIEGKMMNLARESDSTSDVQEFRRIINRY